MELFVDDLDRLAELPATLEALVGQMDQVVAYAQQFVCRRAPFEPSPVCVLRPLAEAMDLLGSAFGEVGDLWRADLVDLRDAARAAHAELVATEDTVVASGRDLTRAVLGGGGSW